MNREIKFRGWDKKNTVMLFSTGSAWVGSEGWYSPTKFDRDELTHPHHLEFMQFTGLKDKNGKEIYEGDIVIVAKRYPIQKINQLIGFDVTEARYSFVYETGEPMRNITPSELPHLEVIGNIYDNPELLKS